MVAPEHEVTEESVTLAHPEIIQQGLRHAAGVFEEAGEASEHLNDLQRGQIIRLLHVLNTCGQTFLLWKRPFEKSVNVMHDSTEVMNNTDCDYKKTCWTFNNRWKAQVGRTVLVLNCSKTT